MGYAGRLDSKGIVLPGLRHFCVVLCDIFRFPTTANMVRCCRNVRCVLLDCPLPDCGDRRRHPNTLIAALAIPPGLSFKWSRTATRCRLRGCRHWQLTASMRFS